MALQRFNQRLCVLLFADGGDLNEVWRQNVESDALRLMLTNKTWPEAAKVLKERYERDLAREAGINDIGSGGNRAGLLDNNDSNAGSRAGFFDSATIACPNSSLRTAPAFAKYARVVSVNFTGNS